MKTTFLICSCAAAMVASVLGQTPTPADATAPTSPVASIALEATATPVSTPIATPSLTPAPTPAIAPSAEPDNEEDFDKAIERKIDKHFKVAFDGKHSIHESDIPSEVIPIIAISCLFFFGTPIAIVGLILYFGFSKSRAMHKTVRMMVEKGQPVPEALLNPPPVVRQRSDLRRGIVLLMIGIGLVVFLGAVNDWEGGGWSFGMIPLLIGLGYLLVWRLDVHREPPSPRV